MKDLHRKILGKGKRPCHKDDRRRRLFKKILNGGKKMLLERHSVEVEDLAKAKLGGG